MDFSTAVGIAIRGRTKQSSTHGHNDSAIRLLCDTINPWSSEG